MDDLTLDELKQLRRLSRSVDDLLEEALKHRENLEQTFRRIFPPLLHETGADINEQGILAMQADQSFNAALKADPTSWEAQYVKYSTMYYWPAELKRDAEVAQKLSALIDQQDAQPSQPHFALTYVTLGNQYQKMGKPEFAEATWRLGLAKFPNHQALLGKLAGTK